MLASLRTCMLTDAGLDWFVRYATTIADGDIPAFKALLQPDAVYQFNTQLPFYGRETVATALVRYRSAFEALRYDLLNIFGTDHQFAVEMLHHYLRTDGVEITIPAAVFIDRDENSGLLSAARIHIDFAPLYG